MHAILKCFYINIKLVSLCHFRPAELQFFTSISSVMVQIPACVFMIDFQKARNTMDMTILTAFILNGVFFHFQSISAYVLMGYISPVTHS